MMPAWLNEGDKGRVRACFLFFCKPRQHRTILQYGLLHNRWSLVLARNESASTFVERAINDRLYVFSFICHGAEIGLKAAARNRRAQDVLSKDLELYYMKVVECAWLFLDLQKSMYYMYFLYKLL